MLASTRPVAAAAAVTANRKTTILLFLMTAAVINTPTFSLSRFRGSETKNEQNDVWNQRYLVSTTVYSVVLR